MNNRKPIAGLLLSLLFAFILVACGGGTPVALATIPVPPAATQLQAGSDPLADLLADGMRQSMSQQGGTVEVQLYTLPAEATWEQVKGFYEHEVTGDWTTEAQLAQDSAAFKTVGWTRGGLASEQGLVVGYSPALLDQPPFIMVALVSE